MHKGLKLKPPENCPPKLAELITSCFQWEPSKRPSFKHIIKVLDEIEADVKSNPFYA
jgi:focal adhesion kinase 1